jgi:biofilm PGA synthesis N-glycosyltransferase PgaC
MVTLFWLCVALVVYVYAGYPVVLACWSWAVERRRGTSSQQGPGATAAPLEGTLPGVSILIAARNEAPRLQGRIENLLASDYPADRIQIIVTSDGSTDEFSDVLARFGQRVELLRLQDAGKAIALNAAAARARNAILVFADCRQRFAPDAIRRLVSHFEDPQIGAVSGELLIDGEGSTIGEGIGAYWRYEKWLRRREAVVGSTLGATGAIYAMRRELWRPLPGTTILDDVLAPMRVVLSGKRVVFDAQARAIDIAAPDAATELRRKIRTLAGNFQLLAIEPRLLLPVANPVWLQFVSHKIGRLLVPYALLLMFGASTMLASSSAFFALAFAGQIAFYGLAVYGAVLEQQRRPGEMAKVGAYREAA